MFLILKSLILLICVLLSVAFLVLAERKTIGYIQRRKGPVFVGFWGVLQSIADGLKLVLKSSLNVFGIEKSLYIASPFISFFIALLSWAFIPTGLNIQDSKISLLFILALNSIGVYGVLLAGLSSSSKWSFLGGLRSAAQIISYELSLSTCIFSIIIVVGSVSLLDIVVYQKNISLIFPLLPFILMLFIISLAEINRAPFDLPEAEAELVAGYNVDYSSMNFAFFFLAEYTHIVLISFIISILFLGSTYNAVAPLFFLFLIIQIRAVLPRYRYDQLIKLGWKELLLVSFSLLFILTIFMLSLS